MGVLSSKVIMVKKLNDKIINTFERERVGLSVFASVLFVLLGTALMMGLHLNKVAQNQNRLQGLSIVQLVGEIPFDRVGSIKSENALSNILSSNRAKGLAYVLLSDLSGQHLAEVSSIRHSSSQPVDADIAYPPLTISNPTLWKGERRLVVGDKKIIEFYAPLFDGVHHKGFVRVGYVKTNYFAIGQHLPNIAIIILPVFLLASILYGLMRRDSKQSANLQEAYYRRRESDNADVASIISDVNRCPSERHEQLQQLQQRVEFLESEKAQSEVNEKIIAYNFSRFEQLLDQLPDGVLALDDVGAPIFINAKAQSLLQVSQAEVVQSKTKDWCDNQILRGFIQRCQKNGRASQDFLSLPFKEGSISLLSVMALPIYQNIHGSREFVGSIIVMKDDSKLAQIQESREQFIAHVSHELKTPLNTLSMYCEALLSTENANDVELKAEAINVIHDESERMNELINNLLNITQLETGGINIDRRRVKMNDFVQDIFDNISKSDASKTIDFNIEMPSVVSPVAIDKNLMRIAINNLLTNAIKYNREGGRVTIKVEELNDQIQITVVDTGIGISAEDQANIFEKFFRSEENEVRERVGHGLGLTLTRDIINLHNGCISVTSELGQGSTFVIEFKKESNLLKWAS